MRISLGQKSLFAIASVALLAGCGSTATSPLASRTAADSAPAGGVLRAAPNAPQTQALDSNSGDVVYVSSFNGRPGYGEVSVFPASLHASNPAAIRQIQHGTARPYGLWVDSAGTLYVANLPQGAPTIGVAEFHPGASAPFRVLTDQMQDPTQVAVAHDGTTYVEQCQRGDVTGVYVTVFPAGSKIASRTIDLHFAGYALECDEMAFNTNGDLLVSAATFKNHTHIFSITPGTFQASQLKLNLGGLDGGGLAVDGAGNIYGSGAYSGAIMVFAPGKTNATRVINQGAESLAVRPDGTLYAATANSEGKVDEYAPGGSTPVNSFLDYDTGLGIAIGPQS